MKDSDKLQLIQHYKIHLKLLETVTAKLDTLNLPNENEKISNMIKKFHTKLEKENLKYQKKIDKLKK